LGYWGTGLNVLQVSAHKLSIVFAKYSSQSIEEALLLELLWAGSDGLVGDVLGEDFVAEGAF